jgi:hypothetical protein
MISEMIWAFWWAISSGQLLRAELQCVWTRLLSSGLRSTSPSSAPWAVIGSYYFLPSGWSSPTTKNGTTTRPKDLLSTKSTRLCFISWFSWSSVPDGIARSTYGTLANLCQLRGSDSSFTSKYVDHAQMTRGVGWVLPLSFWGFRKVAHRCTCIKINIT